MPVGDAAPRQGFVVGEPDACRRSSGLRRPGEAGAPPVRRPGPEDAIRDASAGLGRPAEVRRALLPQLLGRWRERLSKPSAQRIASLRCCRNALPSTGLMHDSRRGIQPAHQRFAFGVPVAVEVHSKVRSQRPRLEIVQPRVKFLTEACRHGEDRSIRIGPQSVSRCFASSRSRLLTTSNSASSNCFW